MQTLHWPSPKLADWMRAFWAFKAGEGPEPEMTAGPFLCGAPSTGFVASAEWFVTCPGCQAKIPPEFRDQPPPNIVAGG